MDVARQLGTPLQTRTEGGCVVRTYRTEMGMVNVLFDHGRSVGLRVAGRLPAQHAAEIAAPAGGEPDLFADGDGWCVTTPQCPPAWLRALAS
jgi:hypothetical protein